MKKFTETYKTKKIDLSQYDTEIQEKFAELDGRQINECCCDCCGEPKCLSGIDSNCCACQDIPNFPIRFYNERTITDLLTQHITAKDMYDIFNQFDMSFHRSAEIRQLLNSSPLYFSENCFSNSVAASAAAGALLTNMRKLQESKEFNNYVKGLCKKEGLANPIVLSQCDGNVSLYAIKNTGTNGAEASIKNSFKETYDLMQRLESLEEITHTNCLDVSIDTIDDVYSFVLKIDLCKMFVLNTTIENK